MKSQQLGMLQTGVWKNVAGEFRVKNKDIQTTERKHFLNLSAFVRDQTRYVDKSVTELSPH